MKGTASGPPQVTTVNLTPLPLLAALQPSTLDAEARTVEVVFYAGGAIPWYEPRTYESCTIELSLEAGAMRLDSLNAGAPLLKVHNAWNLDSVIGVVEAGTARVEGGKALAAVRFVKDDEDADKVWNKVRQGVITAVSVGARIYKYEISEATADQPMQCRALDWEPVEISIAPIGADPGARIRASAQTTIPNACVIVRAAKESTMGDETRTDQQPPQTPPAQPAPAAAATVDVNAVRAQAQAAERERVTGILALGRLPAVQGLAGLDAAFFQGHVDTNTPIDSVRAQVFDKLAAGSEATHINSQIPVQITADAADKWQQGATAWMLMRAGVAPKVAQAARSPLYGHHFQAVATDPGEFRGFTLIELARDVLERRGVRTRGVNPMEVVRRALQGSVTAAGGLATPGEFPTLLENVMNKSMLAAYAVAPDTWRLFCGVGTVTDFRAHNRYRWGSMGALEPLTASGEFRIKSLPDAEKETVFASTRGNIVGISRQAVINDDMSAFSQLGPMLGRAAAISVEIDAYDVLKANAGLGPLMNDGLSLFHATHKNIGTGAAISVESIDGDRVVMGAQKDPSGNEVLDIRPAVLVLAQNLGGTARVINKAEFDVDAVAANATNRFMVPNKVQGLFSTIVDTPRLTGTRRYMFADPSLYPVIEVSFLLGEQQPVLEEAEEFNFDGFRKRVRFDYGVGAVDFRAAVTNAGA